MPRYSSYSGPGFSREITMRLARPVSQNVHSVSHIGAGLPSRQGISSAALVGCIRFPNVTDLNLSRNGASGARRATGEFLFRHGIGMMVPAIDSILGGRLEGGLGRNGNETGSFAF